MLLNLLYFPSDTQYVYYIIRTYTLGFGGHSSSLFGQLSWFPKWATQIFQKALVDLCKLWKPLAIQRDGILRIYIYITVLDFWVAQNARTLSKRHNGTRTLPQEPPFSSGNMRGFCTDWKLSEQWYHLKFSTSKPEPTVFFFPALMFIWVFPPPNHPF